MLYLKEANLEDLEKEYEYITATPANESGFTNPASGCTKAEFETKILPGYIDSARGVGLREGWVPETEFFLWDDDKIVGLFRIRHYLTEALASGAGHIGYGIRKEFRGKGYGSAGLKLTLEKARELVREDEIYMSVRKDNPASLRVQLKNGAVIHHEDEQEYYTRIRMKNGDIVLEKMDVFFENRLKIYDGHMLAEIEGAREFYPFTAAQLPMEAGSRVLDLGCGTGLELEAYFAVNPGADITGIDLSSAMLTALAGKFPDKKLRLINGSYFDVPFEHENKNKNENKNNQYAAAVSVESLHHFTAEQKLRLYQKLFHALAAGGYFILTDYFAESRELEKEYFETLERLKREQNITDGGFYHYDTPLTVEHEAEVLKEAGFSEVKILRNWGATYTLKAVKSLNYSECGII